MKCSLLWLLGALFLFVGLGLQEANAQKKSYPVAVGTFIQWYLVKDWSDAQWQAEFRAIREVGMDTLVFAPSVDSTAQTAYYPTQVSGYKQAKGVGDLIDACLRNAQKASIKVFVGLNFHDDWWKKAGNDPAWLYTQMEVGNTVAEELYRHYHAKYPQAFHGWYWVWEVDNLNFQKPEQAAVLAHALDINVRHLKALDAHMPILLCPFMNATLGTPQAYQALWESVFAHTALGNGDIFCPQDCVGAGGLKLEQVPAWFAALQKAVRTKPGLRFWADVETFHEDDWTSAPLDRFVAQMRAVQPYVEASVTFAYSHYYSPNVKPQGFQQTYRQYVQTGQLETMPPTAPRNVSAVRQPDGSVRLRWEPATDNIGVCGYYVFRDGTRISRKQSARNANEAERITLLDKAASKGQRRYTLQAYDFAGNVSTRVEVSVP